MLFQLMQLLHHAQSFFLFRKHVRLSPSPCDAIRRRPFPNPSHGLPIHRVRHKLPLALAVLVLVLGPVHVHIISTAPDTARHARAASHTHTHTHTHAVGIGVVTGPLGDGVRAHLGDIVLGDGVALVEARKNGREDPIEIIVC